MKNQLSLSRGIVILGILFFVSSTFYMYFQFVQSKKVLDLGIQTLDQNKIQHSLEEEYRIMIAYWAQIYGNDLNKSLSISKAESGFRNICNVGGCKFGQGLFMFIPSTWDSTGEKMKQKTGDVMNPYLNIQRAMYLLAVEGDQHWDMSRHNWE